MKLLVIGSGGREHAISKKLLASPLVDAVYCAPGNPGMSQDGIQLVNLQQSDHGGLIDFAKEQQIAWTFVGPEQPLVAGIADDFERAGLTVFGPNQACAQIEGSKEFAKDLMIRHEIPTADYQVFDKVAEAVAYMEMKGMPLVLKADGLAEGKGVIIPETVEEAIVALQELLGGRFGESSKRVVIEDFLVGEEFSLLAFVHQGKIYPLEIAQDHKRVFEGDLGLNTGGMGAYCPVPQIAPQVVEVAIEQIVRPTIAGLKADGYDYTGVLYAGLIATQEGPKVIEFNARMGDPETQVLLEHMTSDLAEVITAILANRETTISWDEEQVHLGVMVAAKGYPELYPKGLVLPDLSKCQQAVYYSGVDLVDGELVSAGGRVFIMVGKGKTIVEAQQALYQELEQLPLKEYHYRKDIGFKGIS
ncbi:phosphoribosylamine--glycine ligase [Vagococcus sp. BWB3-3]|uniref:Phosphoribosylamine--glycine ligase n=1 Tax=Vagococcus allomyrinae TaxID=2794353 RepID=A0A940PCF6_9ENTE|nr:phosphoribosylamine--glycine ligase [Vagococcus allomyrinae]MBP1043531.1 phosphoribosylamine--glycine ligase [Vagococcus allomyrinae]